MTKKQFWQNASNWGMIAGAMLFIISLISVGFKFEANGMRWVAELLRFGAICSLILYTGRRNATLSGSEGYPYSRAVGFVFAMMMFTGIVIGVGQFLLSNFIAREYFDTLYADQFEMILTAYQGTPFYENLLAGQDAATRMLSNPIYLIFASVFEWICKGGFLGLILCAFVKKTPDFFASGADNE